MLRLTKSDMKQYLNIYPLNVFDMLRLIEYDTVKQDLKVCSLVYWAGSGPSFG